MALENRVAQLEQALEPEHDGPVRIRVVRIPGNLPPDEVDAWVEAHLEEATSKVVEVNL